MPRLYEVVVGGCRRGEGETRGEGKWVPLQMSELEMMGPGRQQWLWGCGWAGSASRPSTEDPGGEGSLLQWLGPGGTGMRSGSPRGMEEVSTARSQPSPKQYQSHSIQIFSSEHVGFL